MNVFNSRWDAFLATIVRPNNPEAVNINVCVFMVAEKAADKYEWVKVGEA